MCQSLFTIMGKLLPVHPAALVALKEQVKEYFSPSHFLLAMKSRVFRQKVQYAFTVKLSCMGFLLLTKKQIL